MKLASVKSESRHGSLILVSSDNKMALKPGKEFPQTMLEALESWGQSKDSLSKLSASLNRGEEASAFPLKVEECIAPIPHAPGFYDGSAFLSHVARARGSRGDVMPDSAKTTPLMYQGVSDNLLPHNSPIELVDESFGGDIEAEFAVVTSDVPRGTKPEQMDPYLALFSFFNDTSFRELLKTEVQTKFGFLQSKPNSAFAPFLVTVDELGDAWQNGRITLDAEVKLNGTVFGKPNGREMNFSFQELVAHACRTRPLSAGNIIGTGTISNEDKSKGFACLTEARYQEIIDTGKASTPWLKPGDEVSMDVVKNGTSVFGSLVQQVTL